MTVLTNDGLLAVADRLGVQTLPLALAVGPAHDDYREWQLAQEAAVDNLTRSGIFDGSGEVTDDVAQAMRVLAQPESELAARVYSGDGTVRICLARQGLEHALAVRRGDDIEVRSEWVDEAPDAPARPVLRAMPSCAPAAIAVLRVPADDLARRLDEATTSAEYTDAFFALGMEGRDATVAGMAFGSCHTVTEIVAYRHGDGVTTPAPGAVAVYDTEHGRIVVAPTVAADHQTWATMTPGSDHRVASAVASLIEGLPGGRWAPE
ncbi:ESX secretion-associated protein EspG [Nocardia sp. BMG51109]|uniref:ESX secretion-associated protein EspG n=1 Tax=Nocardia sp. BMG51109 TaxID=1056816 RepID=UPI0004661715|nr:ESX secretion-associated protein EspG [Nocardia sp. BMG51109]